MWPQPQPSSRVIPGIPDGRQALLVPAAGGEGCSGGPRARRAPSGAGDLREAARGIPQGGPARHAHVILLPGGGGRDARGDPGQRLPAIGLPSVPLAAWPEIE